MQSKGGSSGSGHEGRGRGAAVAGEPVGAADAHRPRRQPGAEPHLRVRRQVNPDVPIGSDLKLLGFPRAQYVAVTSGGRIDHPELRRL